MALGGLTAPGKAAKIATIFFSSLLSVVFFHGGMATMLFPLPELPKLT